MPGYNVDDLRHELLKDLLSACKDDYADQWATFRYLDAKAQNVITVAGVFLAAVLVSLSAPAVERLLIAFPIWGLGILLAAVVFLVVATCISLLSQTVRRMATPYDTFDHASMTEDILRLSHGDLTTDTIEHFRRDVISRWREPLRNLSQANTVKRNCVVWAQVILVSGVCLSAGTLIITAISICVGKPS